MERNAQKENARKLSGLLISKVPADDHSWRLRRTHTKMPELHRLATQLAASTAKRKDAVESRTKANLLIIRNLIRCLFEHQWLVIPTNPDNYKNGECLQQLGLSRRTVEDAITALTGVGPDDGTRNQVREMRKNSSHYMRNGKVGLKIKDYSEASTWRATPKLANLFCELLYEDLGGWDEEHYEIHADCNAAEKAHHTKQAKLLADYNAFIKQHSYAMKGPMRRTFSHYPDRGGRILNDFQNITQRRVPIRKQTLINGEPIAEPDFSANHLRMAAYLCGEELPEDPYTHIVERVDGLTRDTVKLAVTQCLGATSAQQRNGMRHQFHQKASGASGDMFDAILAALHKEYSWTKDVFFRDVGTHLQYLEGEIALKMMSWAMAVKIPLLPVHDSFAVPERYKTETEQAMEISWTVVMDASRDRDKLLDKARERAPAMHTLNRRNK